MQIIIILMFIAFFGETFQVFGIGSYGVTVLDLLTVVFYAFMAKKIIWDGEELIIPKTAPVFLFLGFCATVLLSGITPLLNGSAEQINQFLKTTVHFYFIVLFTFFGFSKEINAKIWTRVIQVWLVSALLINVFGLYQIFARAYDLPLAWLDINNVSFTARGLVSDEEVGQLSLKYMNFYRATSVFPEPSALAGFNIFIFCLQIIPYVQGKKQFIKSKPLSVAIFIATTIGTFATFSLTAFTTIILLMATVFVFEKRKLFKHIFVVLIAAVIMLTAADSLLVKYTGASVLGLFGNRISSIVKGGTDERKYMDGESIGYRARAAKESFIIWEEHPVFGIGMGLTQYSRKTDIMFSHYSSLGALAENGILGFFTFCGMFIAIAFSSAKLLRERHLYDHLDDDLKRLLGIVFYLNLEILYINFFTANQMVWFKLWNPLTIVFSVMTLIHIKNNGQSIRIKLMKQPLKIKLFSALQASMKK